MKDEPWFKMASLCFIAGALMILFGLDFTQITLAMAVETKTYYNYEIEVGRLIDSPKDVKVYTDYLRIKQSSEKQQRNMEGLTNIFGSNLTSLTLEEQYIINNFITYGTVSRKKLLPDQRFLLVKYFLEKNKFLPKTSDDWYLLLAGRKRVKVKEYLE